MRGDNISTAGGNISTAGETSVLWRVFSTVGEEFEFRHVQVINNDEKILMFFVLRYEIFIRKFFEDSSRLHTF